MVAWCPCRYGDCDRDGCDSRGAFLHLGVCHSRSAVVQQVHRAVCEVLHHRCHRPGRCRTRGSASRRYTGTRLLCHGQSSFIAALRRCLLATNILFSVSEVTPRQAQIVLWQSYYLGILTKPLRPTQPPTLGGMGNEYRPKCDDALCFGSKGRHGSYHLWVNIWLANKTVWSLVHVVQYVRPFNCLFSRTMWVSQYQKDKPFLDFSGAGNDGMAVASVDSLPF